MLYRVKPCPGVVNPKAGNGSYRRAAALIGTKLYKKKIRNIGARRSCAKRARIKYNIQMTAVDKKAHHSIAFAAEIPRTPILGSAL